eukprot:10102166-Heterocapsa_arctica.AAC.1
MMIGDPGICLWFLRKENTEDVPGARARLHFPLRARDIVSSDPGEIRDMRQQKDKREKEYHDIYSRKESMNHRRENFQRRSFLGSSQKSEKGNHWREGCNHRDKIIVFKMTGKQRFFVVKEIKLYLDNLSLTRSQRKVEICRMVSWRGSAETRNHDRRKC